jgi:membrane-bound lytic murein transglycosylase B
MKKILLFCTLFSFCLSGFAMTYNKQDWNNWVKNLRKDAISQGIKPAVFDNVFENMTPGRRRIQLDKKQPEKQATLTYLDYRNTRATAARIKQGQREYKKHKKLLQQVGKDYGIDPCYIVAIWGMETSYGKNVGKFFVPRSLATLAYYDKKRAKFFRKELLYSLRILNENNVSMKDFVGAWAGATGQIQFMPSNWYSYAVDYDKDGKKDIWQSYADVFASIANYLKKNGWQTGQPYYVEVTLPANFNKSLIGIKKPQKTVVEWQKLGVKIKGKDSFNPKLKAAIITPIGGPDYMAFANYHAVFRWNHSTDFTCTIGYMAEQVCS